MATLPETAAWVGVYQLEESDPVLGGAPNEATGAGMDNIPHLHLTRRTSWLKSAVDTLVAQVAALSARVVAASTIVAGIVRLNNTLTSTATDQALTAAQGKVLHDAKAPKHSPAFTGEPTAPTPAQFDNDTSIATTAFVQRALGNYQSGETVSGSFTIQAADAGRVYVCGLSTAITITLPSIAETATGASFLILNTGTANVTVQRAGSDTIDNGPGAVTSIVIPPNMSQTVIRVQGSSLWHLVGVPAQSLSSSFGSSLGASGWQRLPSGMIMQWGLGTTGAGGTVAISWPISFPNAFLQVVVHETASGGWFSSGTIVYGSRLQSVTGMTVDARSVNNGGSVSPLPGAVFSYIAFGH